jgi:integrase
MWRDAKIATILRAFQKELKISQTSFHSIRASHITHLLLKGVSPVAVMNSVGLTDYKTTDRYVREINKEKSIENMTDVLDDSNEGIVVPIKRVDVG